MRNVGKKKTTQRFIRAFLTGVSVALAVGASSNPCVAQPTKVSYQGKLKKSGVHYNGTANFKFAFVAGGQTLWSNDGTSVAGSEPTASLAVAVDNGVFGVFLGEPPMVPLVAALLNQSSGAVLRAWVDTGGGFEQLSDQKLASTPFSLHSESADGAPGLFHALGPVKSGNSMFFKGNDHTITAKAGPHGAATWAKQIRIGGDDFPFDEIQVGIGTMDPTATLDVAGNIHASGTITSGPSITMDGTKGSENITSSNDLELRVSSGRALRLEANATSPNLIGGHSGNSVTGAVLGATIAGGGQAGLPNRVTDDYGTIGGGGNNQAGDNAGTTADKPHATVGGGDTNTASGNRATVGGGYNNTASGPGATVAGGRNNSAIAQDATIGGGQGNAASGQQSTVGGGRDNTASALESTVSGGKSNAAGGTYATVGGGIFNTASGEYDTVGGGRSNVVSGDYGTISGGGRSDPGDSATGNRVTDEYGTIGGGGNNQAGDGAGTTADKPYATVGGGVGNTASGIWSTVSGGNTNTASGTLATVGGGYDNTASGPGATVAGGRSNSAAQDATIGGGEDNTASGTESTVGGGLLNTASADWATVGGGKSNVAGGTSATVGGGIFNTANSPWSTVGGGNHNIASGGAATVPGGGDNVAAGLYSFAAGRLAHADHDGSFVWGDNTGSVFASTGANQFLIRAGGGVGMGTNDPKGYQLAVQGDVCIRGNLCVEGTITAASASWGVCTSDCPDCPCPGPSDRRLKDHIDPIAGGLDKVTRLRGVSFQWRRDEFPKMNFRDGQQIGLIAQEVAEVLPEVVVTDPDGYKGIQYGKIVAVLVEAIKEQQQIINSTRSELGELKQRLAAVERAVGVEPKVQRANSARLGGALTTIALVLVVLIGFMMHAHSRKGGAR